MTDEQLAEFCGVKSDDPLHEKFVRSLSPQKRDLFERMAALEMEVELWQAGLAPKPTGVLIDTERDTKRRRGWR